MWLGYEGGGPFSVPGLTITSASLSQLQRSKGLLPKVDHHWLCWDLNEEIIAQALSLEFQGLCITSGEADGVLIAKAQMEGLTIRGLGVESERDIETFLRAGVQGATTNWPDQIY